MHDWNRRAPVALPADQPVAQVGNPTTLHRGNVRRPVYVVQTGSELIPIGSRPEPPLRQAAFDHRTATAPAHTVLDLLMGQHRLTAGTPVDRRRRAIGQAAAVQQQKEPLSPAIVGRIAGVDLPVPVVGTADQLHLPLVVSSIAGRAVGRMHAVANRLVLGGQSERVPAHGMQHIVAAHSVIAADDIGRHIVAAVTHRQPRA